MKIVVYHQSYGCDTGCCGHIVESDDHDLHHLPRHHFTFSHPYGGDHLEYAKGLVRDQFGEEHVADLDWEECLISEDLHWQP